MKSYNSGDMAVRSRERQTCPLPPDEWTHARPAKSRRVFNQGIENRLQVKRRATDDFQNFAGRGLLIQSLGEIAVAFLQFFEEPYVLDGNDGLVCEGFQQSDLLIREWANFGAADQNSADRTPFSLQRGDQYGSKTLPVQGNLNIRKLRCPERQVLNVDQFIVDDRPARNRTSGNRQFARHKKRDRSLMGHQTKNVALHNSNRRVVRTAQPGGAIRDGVQHRLDIRRRTGNDAKNFTRRSLLLQ